MIKYIKYLVVSTFILTTLICNAEVYVKIVAVDGSGDNTTISAALPSRYPDINDQYILYVKNGVYEGQIDIENVYNVSIIGESVDGVIITNGYYNGDGTHSTSSSATFTISTTDFYCENVTFVNSAGSVGQAVAVLTENDRQVFNNCKFKGFQDTYYVQDGMQYNYNCYVEGGTDFIFGGAASVFDSCVINSKSGGYYVTAPEDSKLNSTMDNGGTMHHGILFINSLIQQGSGVSANSCYLGRPWNVSSSSVYINCTLGNHIKPVGWATWDADESTVYFAEYNSVNTSGELIDVSSRADWSYQIPDSIVDKYYTLDYFFTKDSETWDAKAVIKALDAPSDINISDYSISWSAVDNAIGYVIIRNDSTIGYSKTTNFTDETVNTGIENVYKVKSLNSTYGNLSVASDSVTVAASSINDSKISQSFNLDNNILYTESVSDIYIYNLSGKLLKSGLNITQIDLSSLKGVYIYKINDSDGIELSGKIIL